MTTIKFIKAQNGDCFLISFKDDEDTPRNILIDGGTNATYYDLSTNLHGMLKTEIDLLRNKSEYVDLLVLSHIDNDHICGLIKWFEMDTMAYTMVKNVWFNSGKLIAEFLNEPENSDLSVGLKIFRTSETGVKEAIEFEDYLSKKKVWDRKIVLKKETVDNFNVLIHILSPDSSQLFKLLKEYKRITGDVAYTTSKENDWKIPLKKFIEEELKNYQFKQDDSVKNGSSITFLLSIKGKNFLFLADSHPNGISKYLRELGYCEEKPLKVEAIKISHHGSKGNTSNELLAIIETDNYIVSTDGTAHNHPNKRTIARIVNRNPNATIHFNYQSVKENIMLEQDFKDFPNIKIKLTSKLEF